MIFYYQMVFENVMTKVRTSARYDSKPMKTITLTLENSCQVIFSIKLNIRKPLPRSDLTHVSHIITLWLGTHTFSSTLTTNWVSSVPIRSISILRFSWQSSIASHSICSYVDSSSVALPFLHYIKEWFLYPIKAGNSNISSAAYYCIAKIRSTYAIFPK